MTIWAVGDIQGCFQPFQKLLERIDFMPGRDQLWSTGDLVNRGHDNLSTLRWFYRHRDAVRLVLGNHDLHLLATACGSRKLGKSDNLDDILEAPDRDELLDWLRHQPLLHQSGGWVMTHAGIPANWSVNEAAALAAEVEDALRSDDYPHFLTQMYGNEPCRWSPHLKGTARLRVITNTFTRMRYCTAEGSLDFKNKGPIQAEAGELSGQTLKPWFMHRQPGNYRLLFGHWAALEGKTDRLDIIGLDTGCVWGGAMTAMNLQTGKRVSQSAL